MTTKLPIKGNEIFYGLCGMDNVKKWKKDIVSDKSYALYEKNKEVLKSTFMDPGIHRYKKEYYSTLFVEGNRSVFDEEIKHKTHKLYLDGFNRIKSLPKGLMMLVCVFQGFYGVKYVSLNLPVEVIPKSIVSMYFFNSVFPFGPKSDLSSLKNLKVLIYDECDTVAIPKLPKSIEYLSLSGNSIGNGMWDYTNFKLKDYPKLKYFDISKSMIPKNKIPKEWKEAKKAKKIFVLY